ncbi:hypothetical protein HXV90_06365 [Lysinibacillus sp. JK80]|uniref:DUF6236 family protein n=1 Tax=Lysinibacillus sp. JK80 TaxID=2749809 RepID=UPI0022B9A123|nr:hypothetical protein [Lysinibacillus sp. JK80]WBF55497.1 hypothetical protein HXV90_06365 [Lysinibacillus sp. JK80]
MINNYTLYYPTIEFNNPKWLWSAALIWDRVYRIVPNDYQPKDSKNIKELISNSDFISNIDPSVYSSKACEEFIKGCKKETWWAAALDNSNYTKKEYVKLHKDKADVKLREMILAKDTKNNDWINVPHDMASIYMLFLANYIAKRNDISLSTDYAEAWCGSNFFQYDGNISDYEHESQTQLACLTINNFIPINIMDIEPRDLIKFREKRKDERHRFFNSIKELSVKISACEDEQIIRDIFEDHIKEIKESEREYKKSMLDIKVLGWMGVRSLMVPALLPVMQQLVTMSDTTNQHMVKLGLGIGVIGAFWEGRTKIRKERKNYECDYLLQLSAASSRNYTHNLSSNLHEGYQMYLNDNLNHF